MMKRIVALLSALIVMALTFTPALADGEYDDALYIIADSDSRRLTKEELWNYSRETLRYVRNELLARHGYAFEMDKYYNYFNAKPWYEAGGYGTKKFLSEIEWDNIHTVQSVERSMSSRKDENLDGIRIEDIIAYQNSLGGYGNEMAYGNQRGVGEGLTAAEDDPTYEESDIIILTDPATPIPNYIYNLDYIIPDSDSRELTVNELFAYSRETLRYIRNELLARHGYVFGDNKFGRYFGTKDWYVPGGFEDATLSGLEWKNINLVKQVERTMDALGMDASDQLDIVTIYQNQKDGIYPGVQ